MLMSLASLLARLAASHHAVGLSAGAIAGVSVALAVCAAALLAAVLLLVRKRRANVLTGGGKHTSNGRDGGSPMFINNPLNTSDTRLSTGVPKQVPGLVAGVRRACYAFAVLSNCEICVPSLSVACCFPALAALPGRVYPCHHARLRLAARHTYGRAQ
jgi:hypothetical protein